MGWLIRRIWIFHKQTGDLRVRLACRRGPSGREYVLHFDRRTNWLWKRYFRVKYIDLDQVRWLFKEVDRYVKG
jgi:hypothetical protein